MCELDDRPSGMTPFMLLWAFFASRSRKPHRTPTHQSYILIQFNGWNAEKSLINFCAVLSRASPMMNINDLPARTFFPLHCRRYLGPMAQHCCLSLFISFFFGRKNKFEQLSGVQPWYHSWGSPNEIISSIKLRKSISGQLKSSLELTIFLTI